MLIVLLFFNPLLGMAVGAGAGAISGKLSDISINDKMMKDLAASFHPGNSALFVLVRKVAADKMMERLQPFVGKGKVLSSTIHDKKAVGLHVCQRRAISLFCCLLEEVTLR